MGKLDTKDGGNHWKQALARAFRTSDGPQIDDRFAVEEIGIPRNFLTEVARGGISGAEIFSISAYNAAIDTTERVLTTYGPTLYNYLSTASQLTIVSTSANDTVAGTGARQVEIDGLDATFARQRVTYNLNGLTPVTTAENWLRINRIMVVSAGTSGFNEGIINVDTPTPSGIIAQIAAQRAVSQSSVFTVPLGKIAIIIDAIINSDVTKELFFRYRYRDNVLNNVFITAFESAFFNDITFRTNSGFPLLEKYDVEARANTKAGTSALSLFQTILLLDTVTAI